MKIETSPEALNLARTKSSRTDQNETRDNPSQVLERNGHPRKNSTKEPKRVTYRESWVDEYLFLNSWNEHDASEAFIDKLAHDLIAFALGDPKINDRCQEIIGELREGDKPITLNDFMVVKGMWPESLRRWCAKYPKLDTACKQAKVILAARRENGISHNKLSYNPIAKTQHFYCEIWADSDERQAKLKIPEQATAGNITVLMNEFPKEIK